MKWIIGVDRSQPQLLPACVDDYIGPDNPVRLIEAFVNNLDLAQLGFGFPKEDPAGRGRPAYAPSDLLKLYLYGYEQRIRSSRKLEAECQRNLEVMWLLRQLQPDHKTIADFRKDNPAAFKAALRHFNRLCQELELFGGELLAVDGTKVKAQNSPARNWTLGRLQKREQQLQKSIDEYVQALEQADRTEMAPVPQLTSEQLQEKLAQLRAKQSQVQEKVEELKAKNQTQVSATDPESRSMKGAHGFVVGYNVQGAVDAKHHLLVVTEVTTQGNDEGQLTPLAQAAKAELRLGHATVVADGGYYTNQEVKRCQELGLEVHLPTPVKSSIERQGYFAKQNFVYDKQRDVIRCPAGQELLRRGATGEGGYDYDNPAACAGCALKVRCTPNAYRSVSRWEHAECLERMQAQMAAAPEKLSRRKELIEHCWGTFKWLLSGGFLVKGLAKVRTEVSLAHWAYNFKRALRVLGFKALLEHLTRAGRPGPNSIPGAANGLVSSAKRPCAFSRPLGRTVWHLRMQDAVQVL
jgi:transposase